MPEQGEPTTRLASRPTPNLPQGPVGSASPAALRCEDVEVVGQPSDQESRLRLLSHRESQILQLASDGSTNNQIGARLGLSVHAVKFHLSSVYRKLGVANRTEAAVVLMTGLAGGSRSGKEFDY